MYATLWTTADLPQVLYWQTGLLTYVAPLICFTLLVGCIARWAVQPRDSFAAGWRVLWLAFVAGGSNETFAAAQVATLGVAVVLAWLYGRNMVRKRLVTLLGASLAGAGQRDSSW